MERNTIGYHGCHTIHGTYYIPVHAHTVSLWARFNSKRGTHCQLEADSGAQAAADQTK